MKKKNNKKTIIIISIIVLAIGLLIGIGYVTENVRQNKIITKVHENLKGKFYYGAEAGTNYYITVGFDKNNPKGVKINYVDQKEMDLMLTFRGTYDFYFEGRDLMIYLKYDDTTTQSNDYKVELFNVKYDDDGKILSLCNVDEKGNVTPLELKK